MGGFGPGEAGVEKDMTVRIHTIFTFARGCVDVTTAFLSPFEVCVPICDS